MLGWNIDQQENSLSIFSKQIGISLIMASLVSLRSTQRLGINLTR
jgi:hypothetical protein